MRQVHYTISELISYLSDKLKGYKLELQTTNEYFQTDLQFINLAQGLYFFSVDIIVQENIEFIQLEEETNSWNVIYYSQKALFISNELFNSGIYTGFNDKKYIFNITSPQIIHLEVILIHQSYVSINNFSDVFKRIKTNKPTLFYQPMNPKITTLTECLFESKGLIKIKKNILELLNIFKFTVSEIEKQLQNNIETYCCICVEKQMSLTSFLINEFDFESQVMEGFFIEIFGNSTQDYLYNFKLTLARNYLINERAALDAFFKQKLKVHIPSIEPLATLFGLTPRVFKTLFFEELGESIFDYYRKLRITTAKEYLTNNQLKVYQVSEILGYSQPFKFIKNYRKIEGKTPGKRAKN